MSAALLDWVDPRPWLDGTGGHAGDADAMVIRRFLRDLQPCSPDDLETMSRRARTLTCGHFGNNVFLYVPLYLSNFCSGGCAYCGFAADRNHPRTRLEEDAVRRELETLKAMGFDEVLLLTGERCPEADLDYLLHNVRIAATVMHSVTIESFAMQTDEYRQLVDAGCTGVTLYQETYAPELYAELHRWGPKRDYAFRLEAPDRALEAGMRNVGIGALLGLGDPHFEFTALLRHVLALRRRHWRGGVSVSFPRIRHQAGGYQPACLVSDTFLAQAIFAFRLALPDVPLVLSTRETAAFRDGMAGLGVSKMSVASRTTVGGYVPGDPHTEGQFEVEDQRDVATFCAALRAKGLDPVFKNWEALFRG